MWGARYWGVRYWGARYWGKVGAAAVANSLTVRFEEGGYQKTVRFSGPYNNA